MSQVVRVKWVALREVVANHPDNHLMKVYFNRQSLSLLICGLLAVGSIATLACAQPNGADVPDNNRQDAPADQDVAGAEPAEAALPAQAPKIDKWNDAHSIPRNRQFSVSWPKLLIFWLLFLIWVRSVDWVNRDSQIHELGYGKWNLIMFLPFFLVVFFFVFPMFSPLPSFFPLGLGLLFVSYIASFSPYVVIHNKSVEGHQKIFTGDWFRYEIAQLANKVGIKIDAERKAEYEKGVNVDLLAIGAEEERDNQANLITARQSPGYLIVKELVANMVDKRVDRVIIEFTQQSVVERDHIDGVWHNGETRDRESGDVMLAVIKTLAGLDMNERRKKQVSRFGAGYNGTKYICPVTTQGVKTGERVVIDLLGGRREQFDTLEELGMRDKLAERWLELLGTGKGLFILSAMPAGGLTTATDVSLNQTDRLMRDFFAIEEESQREREIENIEVWTYNAAANETPALKLVPIIRKYPNVLIVRDFVDKKTATMLFSICKPASEVRDDRLVITNVHAKEAPEALLRMLQQKVPQRDFAEVVTAVLNVRLVRKLCESCKVAYDPSGELLKKLGIPVGKVGQFYRTPKTEEVDKPCLQCAGIGYRGRSGLFELLVVNQEIRRLLVKQPKLELLRKAARAAHMRTLQEEGILLVARGVTSLQELQRVLSL
jgi:type II secretory ATPase GspE/PulE/Tfp pilus assembly ATPase PilB-like protein